MDANSTLQALLEPVVARHEGFELSRSLDGRVEIHLYLPVGSSLTPEALAEIGLDGFEVGDEVGVQVLPRPGDESQLHAIGGEARTDALRADLRAHCLARLQTQGLEPAQQDAAVGLLAAL